MKFLQVRDAGMYFDFNYPFTCMYSDSRFLSPQIKMTLIHNIYKDSLGQVGADSC